MNFCLYVQREVVLGHYRQKLLEREIAHYYIVNKAGS